MKKPIVLGLNGSPNNKGYLVGLLKLSLNQARKSGAEVKSVNLYDYKILPHTGQLDPKKYFDQTNDDMPMLQKMVLEADALIFATPTHWFSTSSMMKLFIDRMTSLEDFDFLLEGKAAGFITYGPQGGALNNAMQLMTIANQWGMISPPYSCVFDEGRKEAWIKDDCRLLGRNIVQIIKVNREVNWGYDGNKYKTSPIELLKSKKLK